MEETGASGNYKIISNHENLNDFSIPPFSVEEAQVLSEKLDLKETRGSAMKVLQLWLETGQCNYHNQNIFFSLLEKSRSFILDLKKEIEEIEKAKENLYPVDYALSNVMQGLTLMEKKVEIWESLSPVERKDLNQMKTVILESCSVNSAVEANENKQPSSEHCSGGPIDPYTARIISLISILLFEKHPLELDPFEIHSYLSIYIPTVTVQDVELVLSRCPESFKEMESGRFICLHTESLVHMQHLAPKRFP